MRYAVLLALCLAACAPAQERFFSDEEDAEYRKMCEPAGCITLTIPKWLEIIQRPERDPGLGI